MSFQLHYQVKEGYESHFDLQSSTSVTIGHLSSNQVILPGDQVDPIHALLEDSGDGWILTDLGSGSGVCVNGKKIPVEARLNIGDEISIGSFTLRFVRSTLDKPLPQSLPHPPPQKTRQENRKSGLLFTPRTAKASGGVLEVVAYWGDSILNVEHFHPTFKGFERVELGDPQSAHFISANPEISENVVLANAREDGYDLILGSGMTARIRKEGKAQEVGPGSYRLERRDIAHVRFGSIRYFFLFMNPPVVTLPPTKVRDPFMLSLILIGLGLYTILCTALFLADPNVVKKNEEDLWAIVHIPEVPKPELKPEIKVEEAKKPAPVPPPPEPKIKHETKAKAKPLPKHVEKPTPDENLTMAKTQPQASARDVARPPLTTEVAIASHVAGGGRKGSETTNTPATPLDVKKPSGINLGKLGLGVGQVKSFGGVGAIQTNFKDSAGGVGTGTGIKTLGLGGLGSAQSVGLTGTANVAEQFGTNMGAANGLSKAFGAKRGDTSVNVRGGDPLIAGGLTQEEILNVIRLNVNQIRHCYEKLLQSSPNSRGKIKTKFVINLAGGVSDVSISESEFQNELMNNCVVDMIKRWKFPEPRGSSPVNVSYPFSFNPL